MELPWLREEGNNQPVHVYPLNDEATHVLEGIHCWCNPEVREDGFLIIHNSFDGREFFEDKPPS